MHGAGRAVVEAHYRCRVVGNIAKMSRAQSGCAHRPLQHRCLCAPSRYTPRATAHIGGCVEHFGCQLASTSTMDPRYRLWVELIFPRCASAPAALLALRAVCRAWRLWLPFTMVLPQLRYDERIEG